MNCSLHGKTIKYFFPVIAACMIMNTHAHAQPFSSAVKQFISINADTVVLTHVKIVDGTGSPSKTDQTIVIVKGRIAQVGNSNKTSVPVSAKIIDCSGKT